jgi:hypothetical protein
LYQSDRFDLDLLRRRAVRVDSFEVGRADGGGCGDGRVEGVGRSVGEDLGEFAGLRVVVETLR